MSKTLNIPPHTLKIAEPILHYLVEHPDMASSTTIAKAVGATKSFVQHTMARLVRAGMAEIVFWGKHPAGYRLTRWPTFIDWADVVMLFYKNPNVALRSAMRQVIGPGTLQDWHEGKLRNRT